MGFRYENSNDQRLTGTIADLMLRGPAARAAAAERIGEIQARGAQQSAGAWAGAAQNIGDLVGAIPAQMQQARRAKLQDQLGALQLRSATQSAADDQRLRDAYSKTGGDPTQMRALLAGSGGLTLQHDQTLQQMEQQKQARDADLTTSIGLKLHEQIRPDDPTSALTAMQEALNTAEQHKLITSEQAQSMGAAASADPSRIADVAKGWIAASARGQALLEKTTILKEGEKGFGFDKQPVPGMSLPEKDSEVEVAKRAAAGDPIAIATMNRLKPPPARTAEADKAEYLSLAAKKSLGQPLTPEEQAKLTAYEQEKTLGVDKSAAAAADRQTASIGAQTAQQKRAQDFAQLQAARADIEKNVQTPYLTAQNSANTLRDVVTAAKAGNKVAGSLQALETTMAAIRAQGLNRINATEVGVTANAGSMYDRIVGWLGKKAEGQPVPADIQKDMLEFSDILEKAAYKKYLAGHKATTDLYGITTLKPTLSGPAETVTTSVQQRARDILAGAGKASDDAAVAQFLKNNPGFK